MDTAPAHRHKRIRWAVPSQDASRLETFAPNSTPKAGIAAITPMAKLP